MTRRVLSVVLLGAVIALLTLATACAPVKPWQKGSLAPPAMSLQDCSTHRFERNAEVYREGAVGANGGKSGGGCGCS